MLRSKAVRFVLCVFMLPLCLVLVTSGAANAADSELVTITVDDSGFLNSATCVVPLALQVVTGGTSLLVGQGGYCKGGPDTSPGFCGMLEAGCTTVELSVIGSGGECASGPVDVVGSSGTMSTTLNLGGGFIPLGSCDPVQICLAVTSAVTLGTDWNATGCTASTLDPPVIPTEFCTAAGADVGRPYIMKKEVIEVGASWRGRVTYAGSAPAASGAGMDWMFYALNTDGANTQGAATRPIQGGNVVGLYWKHLPRPLGSVPEFTFVTESGLLGSDALAAAWNAKQATYGIGLYSAGNATANSTALQIPVTLPSVANQTTGRVGINDPTICTYYWGEKVAEKSGTDPTDEPAGPVVESETGTETPDLPPVPPPDPDPDGSIPDFGWLAALLGKLINAVVSLASAIVNGIVNALQDLFIPESGFLDNRIENLSSAWDDTAIGKLGTALGDINPGGVSGCGGMPLEVDFGNGVTISESIGAACSGSMATAAGMVRMAISAVLVLGGAVACVRAVGSGFGWNPGIGQGTST